MQDTIITNVTIGWRAALLGLFAAVLTLVLSLAIHPIVAIALPIIIAVGAWLSVRPQVAVIMLIFFSYLDGISDKIFAASPISGFKLISAAAVFGLMVTAHRRREFLRAVFAAPITRWAIGFSMAWAVAILMSQSKSHAFDWGMRIVSIKMVFYFVILALKDEEMVKAGVRCLALATAVSAVFLILDIALGVTLISTSEAAISARTAEGFERSSGASQYNPTTAATMLLCGAVLALVHAIETPAYRRVMLAFAFLGVVAVVLSFARSAALVYGVIVILLAIRYGRMRLFAPFVVIAIICAIALLPFIPESYYERISSIFGGGGGDWTLGRRMTYNIIGVDLVLKYPIFGVGPGNFFDLFTDPEYRYLPGRTLLGRQLHNMYLSVMVDYGLIGFAFFMGMILCGFRMLKAVATAPANDDLRALAVALHYAMLAYYMVSVFVPNEYCKYTWLLPALAGSVWLLNNRLISQVSRANET